MVLKNPGARALYLFPTKALAQDQLANLHDIVTALNRDIKTYTYDGDTPPNARKLIRTAGHIVISNPDMLHTGVLPHHTKWVRLFENLRYIVIDELHNYRGVFGSHVANVMRRLMRICEFYGSARSSSAPRPPSPTRRSSPSASPASRLSPSWTTTARRKAPNRSSSIIPRWSTGSLA